MKKRQFQARAKTLQKMSRDGLVEQNLVTGDERRISQRTADISFGSEHPQEPTAGHRAAQRTGADTGTSKKRYKQQRILLQTAEETADTSAPEADSAPTALDTPSMRMAADAPMLADPVREADRDPPVPLNRRKRKKHKKSKQRQAMKHTPEISDLPDTIRTPPHNPDEAPITRKLSDSVLEKCKSRCTEGGGRLKFETDEEISSCEDTQTAVKKRPFQRRMLDAGKTEGVDLRQSSRPMEDPGERLKFEETAEESDAVSPESANTHPRDSPPSDDSPSVEERKEYQKRQTAKYIVYPAVKPDRTHLQFEDTPFQASADPSLEKDAVSSNRKYEKAKHRAERAEQNVEQARENLPVTHRLHIRQEIDSETGRPRRRLRFESEVQPEFRKTSLPVQAGNAARTAAVMKIHGKIHESERENTAVESAHKSELFLEQGAGRVLRYERNRRAKPYRVLYRAEQRLEKESAKLAWQTALRDHPELWNQSSIRKWAQKQNIKRKYAKAAREAKQAAQFAQNAAAASGQIARAAVQYAAARKSLFAAAALLALTAMFFSVGLTACTAMLSGFQTSYISASYLADEPDICNSDLYYTEMETDLQIDINETEANYPGYDEYRCRIGEISHSPYELLGYLSAAFDAFTFDGVRSEIQRLFGEQYTLTRETIVETRYDSDDDPYDWYILQTTLTVRPLSVVIAESLTPGEQTSRYSVYMQTLGNRQAFGNPFDFSWLRYVSSGYGYRVHPITGQKNLHRGVDIAAPEGTPIRAIQDGRVIAAGDSGGYGLCVVIGDEKGYQSRYAHCSSLFARTGQEVKRGDMIAAVGSTGDSTGPHLHLEVMLDGEYLNPYFFVDTGNMAGVLPGETGGPVIPDDPGEPVEEGVFAAMLAEAEKYLGMPYVWGGSSPSVGFDCSGYVSWVLNHSGWNVGRLGAQGLYDLCTPVSAGNLQPGDLVFFWHTYDAPDPDGVTHVGVYIGNGQMIHCGDPVSYANLSSGYWQSHFYAGGRLP